uniref:HEAT repeat-containing protein 1 n=2 Tax=Ditylum brightwellii TaxID=49249 RepID=A0A7S2ELE7_9STRA
MGIDDSTLSSSSASNGMDIDDDVDKESGDNLVNILPPRVALEHPDASVRLVAIQRLVNEELDNALEEKEDSNDLVQSLLRRIASDSEECVVAAAGRALEFFEKNVIKNEAKGDDDSEIMSIFTKDPISSAEYILAALRKLSIFDVVNYKTEDSSPKKKKKHRKRKENEEDSAADEDKSIKRTALSLDTDVSKDRIDAICTTLYLAGSTISAIILDKKENIMDDDSDNGDGDDDDDEEYSLDMLHQLVCSVAAHLDLTVGIDIEEGDNVTQIEHVASLALLRGLSSLPEDNENDNEKPSIEAKVMSIISSNEVCTDALRRYCKAASGNNGELQKGSGKKIDAAILRFMGLSLISHVDAIESSTTVPKDKNDGNHLQDALSTIISILRLCGDSLKKGDGIPCNIKFLLKKLQPCLNAAVKSDVYQLPDIFIDLASVESSLAYNLVSAKAMSFILIDNVDTISPVMLLMEACSRQGVDSFVVVRLIGIASEITGKTAFINCISHSLIPALSLLSHTDRKVREAVLKFVEALLSRATTEKHPEHAKEIHSLLELFSPAIATEGNSSMQSAILMDGPGALPLLLRKAVQESPNSSFLVEFLLRQCTLGFSNTANPKPHWSRTRTPGGCYAAAVLLSSMASVGEDVFPLIKRWKYAGEELFEIFLADSEEESVSEKSESPILNESVKSLMESAVLMLKGVIVDSAKNDFVITTGPGYSGRRSRSYSVGTSDVKVVDPYPARMVSSILKCLRSTIKMDNSVNCVSELQKCLIDLVLSRQSWADNVFPKIVSDSRIRIASSLLILRSVGDEESAGSALLVLPLNIAEFSSFMCEDGPVPSLSSAGDLLALTFIADCIRWRSDALAKDTNVHSLSNLLFDRVASLSAGDSNYSGSDYTRICLLQTLLAIHENIEKQKKSVSKSKASSPGRRRSRSNSGSNLTISTSIKKKYSSQARLLVSLIGGEESSETKSQIRPLATGNGKEVALGLLTYICSESPAIVVDSLIPAILQICAASFSKTQEASVNSTPQVRSCGHALLAVVPSFCARADSAGLSVSHLLKAFVTSFHFKHKVHHQQKLELYKHFAESLLSISSDYDPHKALSDLVGYFLAFEVYQSTDINRDRREDDMVTEDKHDYTSSITFALDILLHAPATTQVHSSLQLLRYAGDLIDRVGNDNAENDSLRTTSKGGSNAPQNVVDGLALANMATAGSESSREQSQTTTKSSKHQNIMILSANLLKVIKGGLSSKNARRLIRKSEGTVADMCLRLWQELMQLQVNTIHFRSREVDENISLVEKEFMRTVPAELSECRECLQRLLPVPHFLASVTSLLKDEETGNSVRKRAIQLLSERALETDPMSAEASLFLEMVPDLVRQVTDISLKDKTDIDARRTIVVQQGALISIECIGRTFCLSPDKKNKKGVRICLDALSKLSRVLHLTGEQVLERSSDGGGELTFDDAKSQLLSSAAICSSTLVRVVGSKCLPFLQNLMKPILSSLSSVNSWLGNNDNREEDQPVRLLQVSLLRALIAVTETVPQFLVPFLGEILSPLGLPSWALRQESVDGDNAVKSMSESLDRALAIGTPARQLIPASSEAIQKALSKEHDGMGWREAKSIFTIMKSSIEFSPRSEINPVIGRLINALLLGYGYDKNTKGKTELLCSANECLLAIVMKLSENQLRPLYARLREWRGDIDESGMENTSYSRRYAFWSLSAALSKELRSIFLPCLSTVIGDAVTELDFAVNRLCDSSHLSKTSGGKKRRRLDHSGKNDAGLSDLDELSPLQPLLLSLELALKSDAHEGGGWVRSDDGQRYNAILNPLGKLLEANIPPNFPVDSSSGENKSSEISPFQQLVSGVGTTEHGNVIACLTALAAAAGNEQLWKPLNHAILQACGNDSRSEVRKAGASALLTIIQTLGEEYMVLLPECLPILSELLEDSDEEIASIAKECIRQGEELLGESLDDSLI